MTNDALLDLEPGLARLPPEAGTRLRVLRPQLRAAVLGTVRAAFAGQGRPVTGRNVELGVRTAVDAFADGIADPSRTMGRTLEVFHALGRTEFDEGHRVDALRAVVTLGAREIWAFVTAHEVAPPADLYLIAGALFGFADSLTGVAAEGYLAAQRESGHDWALARRRLITLLAQADPPGEAALHAAADAARWPLPETVVVASVEGTDADHLARVVGAGAVAAVIDDAARVVVPSPPALDLLKRSLAGRRAALGPVVETARARLSYRLSQRALATGHPGVIECDAHLVPLLLGWEPGLAEHLAGRVLAPLDGLRPAARATMETTLLAWLREQGQVIPAAAALHTHPQTVRYRLRRLRALFGDALDAPDTRLSLWIGLTSRCTPPRPASPPARPGAAR
ncbi:helix-turn-helix domain-containing protein [Catenuloplanes japonicus]|uniref:helix-turn-helix domain-containing protein n=1 Tax=Catenuloplanes japonicus TaxID=33876 RepID=UPI0005258342|nr:helix-turn-helix domain-containing protein [Catenuloplanes japonicus]